MKHHCSQFLNFQNVTAQLEVESALAETLYDLQNILTVLAQTFPDNTNLATASTALQAAADAFVALICKFEILSICTI